MNCYGLFISVHHSQLSSNFPVVSWHFTTKLHLFFLCWGHIKTIDYFTISVWVVFQPPNLWGLRGIAPFERSTGEWFLTSRGELPGQKDLLTVRCITLAGFYHWITSPWKKPRLWSTMWFQAPVHSDIAARLLCGWWSSWIGRWIQWLGLRETLSYR